MEATMVVPPSVYNQTLNGVQSGLKDSCDQSRYYQTPQIYREMSALSNAVDHLRLDDTFVTRSANWNHNFPQRQLATERSAVMNTMSKGGQVLNSYRTSMTPDTIKSMQDNQVREQHHQALGSLRGLREELNPLATAAHTRVQQFSDWIGVTDRYTGYRHNLSRPRQPLHIQPNWRRGENHERDQLKFAPEMTPERQTKRFNIRARTAPPKYQEVDTTKNGSCFTERPQTAMYRSPQEAAGINLVYPGRSEYRDRYLPPSRDASNFDYTINPTPDFSVIGRPLLPKQRVDKITEYKYQYEWPIADRCQKLPWLRSK